MEESVATAERAEQVAEAGQEGEEDPEEDQCDAMASNVTLITNEPGQTRCGPVGALALPRAQVSIPDSRRVSVIYRSGRARPRARRKARPKARRFDNAPYNATRGARGAGKLMHG